MSLQNVFIVGGSGKVGMKLIEQIRAHDGINHEHKNPTVIVGVATTSHFILNSAGILVPQSIETRKEMKSFVENTNNEGKAYTSHEDILDAIRKIGMEGDTIFIDVSADGEKMVQFHKDIIMSTGNRLVTANKKPAAADMTTFETLTGNPHRYRYNTTVMAGAGAVPYFQEAHGLSEEILSVEGTFSGTLAYVCSELEKGEKTFSQIVREAQQKGYTEPHPIEDLNGEDVERKLLILLRSAGIRIEDNEIELTGMVNPDKYVGLSPEEFLSAIEQEDVKMKEMIKEGASKGLVPRYIASYKQRGDKMQASVSLQFVPKESEIGGLKGTANKVLIHTSQRTPLVNTDGVAQPPHVITSPGAGLAKTAASVRADLLYLLDGTNLWQHN